MDILGGSFDHLLLAGATITSALAGSWLGLIAAAALVEAASGGRWQALRLTGCPLAWRRRLLRLLVPLLAPGIGVSAPSWAAEASPAHDPLGGPTGSTAVRVAGPRSLAGLPLPDRQQGAAHDTTRRIRVVEVRPGDTLWAIAAATLPRGAGAAAAARRCREIHEQNRAVIGDDPDLIRPGQRLRVPIRPPEEKS